MCTVYCIETENSYGIKEDLLVELLNEGVVISREVSSSFFPKYVFHKKDLSKIITKSWK